MPRFCYHEKLTIAANCRMCLVEVEKAPKPMPACATPVAEGMKVFTKSPKAIAAQKAVMEFLLINHPLDCPICDQGGECELQDLAMGFGRDISRYTERKRVVKDKNLGPLVSTDMTRCIHCTRCVRFTQEIQGFQELGTIGRGELTEIGTFIEKSVDHELSANIIDLCPVGALNNKPYRYRARAWEMTQHPLVSPHDSVGANLYAHVLRGRVMRIVPRANEEVNETWIADRDRFSYQGIYSDDRLLKPMVRDNGVWQETDWETALLAPIFGFLPGDDERAHATVLAIADELTEHGFVLRYRTNETDDGLSGKEARSSSARTGWCRRCRSSASNRRRATCSSASCASRRRSGSTPRSSTSTPASTSATSRRPSPTSPYRGRRPHHPRRVPPRVLTVAVRPAAGRGAAERPGRPAASEAGAGVHDAAVDEDRGRRRGSWRRRRRGRRRRCRSPRARPCGRSGSPRRARFIAAGSASVAALIGVSTAPGPTPTTSTPCGASSTPAVRVSIRMPPLDRQYGVLPGIGQSSWTEVMLMIRPPSPWAIICLAAIWVPKKALFRLMSSTRSYCASVVSSTDVRVSMPALLTITSTRPNALHGAVDEPLQVGDLADVGLDADGLVAEGVDALLQRLGGLGVGHVVDDDAGALLGEGEHDAPCRCRCCHR